MAKDTDVVNPEPQIEAVPIPQISEPPAGQPLDQAGDSEVTLESFRSMVREEMQSVKDTRLGQLGTKVENLESAFAQRRGLVADGMSEKEAERKMLEVERVQTLEERLQAIETGKSGSSPSPGGGEELLTEKQASILSGVGMTTGDPRFTQFLRDNPKFKTNKEYFEALDKEALVWQTDDAKKPQPSGTSVAQVVPSVPAGDGSYTAEKYKIDMLAAQGKPDEVRRIKEAARKDGVDVDNIGFGT